MDSVFKCYSCEEFKNNIEKTKFCGEEFCEKCIDKLDDKTGYCSLDCMMGFGCDGSC